MHEPRRADVGFLSLTISVFAVHKGSARTGRARSARKSPDLKEDANGSCERASELH